MCWMLCSSFIWSIHVRRNGETVEPIYSSMPPQDATASYSQQIELPFQTQYAQYGAIVNPHGLVHAEYPWLTCLKIMRLEFIIHTLMTMYAYTHGAENQQNQFVRQGQQLSDVQQQLNQRMQAYANRRSGQIQQQPQPYFPGGTAGVYDASPYASPPSTAVSDASPVISEKFLDEEKKSNRMLARLKRILKRTRKEEDKVEGVFFFYIHTYTHIHTCLRSCTRRYIFAHIFLNERTHVCKHVCDERNTHTHTHTHMLKSCTRKYMHIL